MSDTCNTYQVGASVNEKIPSTSENENKLGNDSSMGREASDSDGKPDSHISSWCNDGGILSVAEDDNDLIWNATPHMSLDWEGQDSKSSVKSTESFN